MRKVNRIITIAISLIIIVTSLSKIPEARADVNREVENKATVICEIPELRRKNADTYLLSDGSFDCVVYTDNKYYDDGTGKLVPIDNTIIETCYSDGKKEYHYKNAANDALMYFAANDPAVLLTYEEKKLGFSYMGSLDTEAQLGGLTGRASVADYVLYGDNYIAYPNVAAETDLVYAVNNGNVKEYIVLNNMNSAKSFDFSFEIQGYMVEINEFNRITFFDAEGNAVFELGSLYAIDSAGHYTDQVHYGLKDINDESVVISVTLSEAYANDSERVYPILIDPSVMITGANVTYDTFTSSRFPDTNFFEDNHLRTGYDEDLYKRRTFMRFQLPDNIPASTVTTAYIKIRQYIGTAPEVKAYLVLDNWVSGQLTWNTMPDYTGVYASDNLFLESNNWYKAYITEIVIGWLNSVYGNFGIMLRDSSETTNSRWTTFYSSEAPSPNKPELHIQYNGLNYWYSQSTDIGKWNYSPKVKWNKLNNSSSFYFSEGLDHAKTQWNNALGLSITISPVQSGQIIYYGGNIAQLNETGLFGLIDPDNAGYTMVTDTFTQFYSYSGVQKKLYTISSAVGYILYKNNFTQNEYLSTVTHEMGHALGWFGHPNPLHNDWVMYEAVNSVTQLQNEEKQHLAQVY